ncbi:hypothetical protein AVEN_217384-1 [Araneus ventricosus]|uniref:Uncharacterized protein n=1 Tax=Araneus ventricosus TaxID=182803 RepID=A0A4Y2HXU5_ARAVE|nr:hypothetical protein AVEN_217384-1 [Araneus ventricosus]
MYKDPWQKSWDEQSKQASMTKLGGWKHPNILSIATDVTPQAGGSSLILNNEKNDVAEGEDRYYLKEDDGASKVTNMPFIYNTLKPIFTRHTCQLQISSITESIDD